MKVASSIYPLFALGLTLLSAAPVSAQQHRATRLGSPATRFAPPLTTPEGLRALFRNERLRPDIASILDQWGWKGNLADLHQAALTAEITQIQIPVGDRMPFMSSRRNGRPVTLRDVLWAGKEPISAYAFLFSSNGRRYRCVTPKACSNFFLEDLGPDTPELELVKTVPLEASLCDPIEVRLMVRNPGGSTLTDIRVTDPLPAGLRTLDNQSEVNFGLASLPAGESREARFQVLASAAGQYVNVARATSSRGAVAEATATMRVRAPVLALDCEAPGEVLVRRPFEVCFTVSNRGDVVEPQVNLELPIPEGARVVRSTEGGLESEGRVTWAMANLAPNASKRVCVVMATRQTGPLSLSATAAGGCAPPVQSACALRILGVPAILLEVVDLVDPIALGEDVTYEIRVTNQGTATLHNVQLLCTLPASQQWVSGSGSAPVRVEGAAITTEDLPVLVPKAVASWQVVVKAMAAGDTRFRVELRSREFEEPIVEAEATQQY